MSERVLSILTSVLGSGKPTSRDNHSFYCPVCKHRKRKLEVAVDSHKWHCWVCDKGGTNLFSLFKWVGAPSGKLDELRAIVGTRKYFDKEVDEDKSEVCVLPAEYIPLWKENHSSYFWRAAVNYLSGRGLTPLDIIKHRIGYCVEGDYKNMVIIPNYDQYWNLNYFMGRAFLPAFMKFKNPNISRNVIGFESYLDWNEPIVIVESPLDAITVRRNASPLLGKSMSMMFRERVVSERVGGIYLCMDADAIIDAVNHVQFFLDNGVDVYLTMLPDEEDPNSIGYPDIWNYIDQSIQVDESILFRLRMEDHLYGNGKANLPHRRYSRSIVSSAQRISGSFL